MEISELLILLKSKLRENEMEEIREHCKDNDAISVIENRTYICVHLHDERELPFHLWVFDLLCKTKER